VNLSSTVKHSISNGVSRKLEGDQNDNSQKLDVTNVG